MPLPRSRNVVPDCVPDGTSTVSSSSSSAGHDDLAAERERREVHRHLAVQVVAVALEELVILHVHDDVEIAGRAAGRAVLALAVEAQPLPGRDAGRDLDGELALLRHVPGAAARRARLGDDLAGCRGTGRRCARR